MSEPNGHFSSQDAQWRLHCESLAESMGDRRFLSTVELRSLQKYLRQDESTLAITNGKLHAATPLLVLTNRRLLMLERVCNAIPAESGILPIYAIRQHSISLEDSAGVLTASCGLSRGSLTIKDGETEWRFWDVPNETIVRFMEKLKRALESVGVRPAELSISHISARSRMLDCLRAQGLLTDEEFVRLQQRALL